MESAPDLPEAFYLPVGEDEFESTAATMSPWDETMQHGGPPAALLARAVEQVRPDPDMSIARHTVDMLGPIPQGRIRTEAKVVRPGKRVELVEAQLFANDRLAVSATAWRIRQVAGSTEAHAHTVPVPPLPEAQPQRFFPGLSPVWGYGRAIEWRFVTGSFLDYGPASVWTRVRIPVVAGEESSSVQRLAVVADSANGISGELPHGEWLFIPPTLTLTLGRAPVGPWIYLTAQTLITGSGTGVTVGEVLDSDGLVGSVAQALLIAPR